MVVVTLLASGAAVIGPARVAEAAEPPTVNTVSAYGTAPDLGPTTSLALNRPLVGMAATPSGQGYWLVASDGGIFSYGDAAFHGSTGAVVLNQPIVGMASTPSGQGYWLVASDGGIFSFGDARFFGSTGAVALNQPIVGMAPAPAGDGYWLVASDGGIFSFGAAQFKGSTGSVPLNQPIVGMARTPTGQGYWLVARDAGIFTFGDATFKGSMASAAIPEPAVGIAVAPDGRGYWIASRDGEVYAFGVPDHGSAAETNSDRISTMAVVAHPGDGYWLAHGDVIPITRADSGPQVEKLQRRLVELGYWLGVVDGVFGETTRQAVYAFQKLNGLPTDGVAGGATLAALDRAGRPVPTSTSGDLVEVDKTRQVLFVVRGGQAHLVFNTSTGTERPYTFEGRTYQADTPVGRFTITRQIDGVHESDLGVLYRPKYFHPDGIAVHGSSSVPPYPASHGCVRVTNAAIDYLWSSGLAPVGSAVWVHGTSPRR